jgi:DMSO reductase iron-sulfur subunit
MQKGFLFDINKCTGCHACQIACALENELGFDRSWRQVVTYNEARYPELPYFHLSLACNHCGDPPCMMYCPALAYYKDNDSGVVVLETQKCIGCNYCAWVCPYDAPDYNQAVGIMEKCTLCQHRLQEGLDPACTALCPTDALQYGDVQETERNDALPGFPDRNINPAIRINSLRPGSELPEMTLLPFDQSLVDTFKTAQRLPQSKICFESEWILIIFTFLSPIFIALVTASLLSRNSTNPLYIVFATLFSFALSTLHLGKKMRAWRAVLNCKHSWLSREVLFWSLFLMMMLVNTFILPGNNIILGLASLAGFTALFSMDRVYQVTMHHSLSNFHSANTLFTAFLFVGLFSANPFLFSIIWILKLYLYLKRKISQHNMKLFLSILRIGSGYVLPILLWMASIVNFYWFLILCIILSELIDRIEFYLEFDIVTPFSELSDDIRQKLPY